MSNTKHGHYTVSANATLTVEVYDTEKGSEREFNRKMKVVKAVAKALGLDLWVDEVLVEE